jgi:hypothetical protein
LGSRTGLDGVKRTIILSLPVFKLRPLGRPARNQSLYLLRYLRVEDDEVRSVNK